MPTPNHKNAKGIPAARKTLSMGSKTLKLYKLRSNVEISKYKNSSNIIHQEKLTESIVLTRAVQSNIL